MTPEAGIELRTEGHQLFEYAELLGEILGDFPEVGIVLSTSWCRALRRFDDAKVYLPEVLQQRVIGATWHSHKPQYQWAGMTRYEQIMEYVCRHGVRHWLAIDDDVKDWPERHQHALVQTHSMLGLGDPEVQCDLREKLLRMREAPVDKSDAPKLIHQLPGMCW